MVQNNVTLLIAGGLLRVHCLKEGFRISGKCILVTGYPSLGARTSRVTAAISQNSQVEQANLWATAPRAQLKLGDEMVSVCSRTRGNVGYKTRPSVPLGLRILKIPPYG